MFEGPEGVGGSFWYGLCARVWGFYGGGCDGVPDLCARDVGFGPRYGKERRVPTDHGRRFFIPGYEVFETFEKVIY